jgi:hypothetical protein
LTEFTVDKKFAVYWTNYLYNSEILCDNKAACVDVVDIENQSWQICGPRVKDT